MSLTTRILQKAAGKTATKACIATILPTASFLSGRPVVILGRRTLHSASKAKSPHAVRTRPRNNQRIHSSATNSHSAAAAAVHLLETSAAVRSDAPLPSHSQLKTLFVSSAIPMVGFGFMDNFIMIQAGGYIDATLGVQFGLATLTAAAMGQVVSDVSGVVFGGSLERFLERIKLIKPSNLSVAQRQLPIARNTAMAGAVLGVMGGCLLGATSLMFIDLEVHERQKHALELQVMLTSMLAEDEQNEASMGCETCTVYLASEEHIPAGYMDEETREKPLMKLLESAESDSLAAKCKKSQEVCVDNHLSDGKSILCAPVVSDDGKVLAVLEFRNRHEKHGSKFTDATFTEDDERTARILARHIAIFMDRLASSPQ